MDLLNQHNQNMNQPQAAVAAAAAAIERPMSRKVIRLQIQRIILSRVPPQIRHLYSRRTITQQTIIFDEFLYKTASCVSEYVDRRTLESRILFIAKKMMALKMKKLFVYFDLR